MRIKNTGLALCLSLLLSGGTQARQTTHHAAVSAIADGADSAARARAIADSLKRAGVQYRLEDFTFPAFSGSNIVADVPGQHAAKTFLLGAHYDRVAQGHGAVDNASSCVVLMDLLATFQSKPLENYNVKAVFFDLEEGGLVGSQAYFAKARDGERPSFALNLDIFGYGDTLFATGSAVDGPLMAALQQAAKEAAMPVRAVAATQYPASDHRIMIAAGIDTVGLALIDGAEVDAILQHSGSAPRIMTIIHTPEDTIDKVRDDDVAKSVPVLERMLRLIDAR